VLDFGRYAGWSLARLWRVDPGYLEWLARSSAGRHLAGEIAAVGKGSDSGRSTAFSAPQQRSFAWRGR
jgi:hypothetical protein